jgi:hypothetical protein
MSAVFSVVVFRRAKAMMMVMTSVWNIAVVIRNRLRLPMISL